MTERIAYEKRDIQPRQIGYSAASLFGGLGLSVALVAGILLAIDHYLQPPPATVLEQTPLQPPPPRLEIDGRADGQAVEAEARGKLDGYAWVDRSAGIARIPVARAMQLLAAHGWPDDAEPGKP